MRDYYKEYLEEFATEGHRWLDGLKKVEVYPADVEGSEGNTIQRYWASAQCDGCYHILRPDEPIDEYIVTHYPHRNEVVKDLPMPTDHADGGPYASTAWHIRQYMIADMEKADERENQRLTLSGKTLSVTKEQ